MISLSGSPHAKVPVYLRKREHERGKGTDRKIVPGMIPRRRRKVTATTIDIPSNKIQHETKQIRTIGVSRRRGLHLVVVRIPAEGAAALSEIVDRREILPSMPPAISEHWYKSKL